jgi:hypothetical protein
LTGDLGIVPWGQKRVHLSPRLCLCLCLCVCVQGYAKTKRHVSISVSYSAAAGGGLVPRRPGAAPAQPHLVPARDPGVGRGRQLRAARHHAPAAPRGQGEEREGRLTLVGTQRALFITFPTVVFKSTRVGPSPPALVVSCSQVVKLDHDGVGTWTGHSPRTCPSSASQPSSTSRTSSSAKVSQGGGQGGEGHSGC